MSGHRIARRYAKALFKVCDKDLSRADQWIKSLDTLDELFDHQEAGKILRSPVMPSDLKKKLLAYGLEQASAEEALKNFFETVVDAGRVDLVPDVMTSFRSLVADAKGNAEGEAVSATELNAEVISAIEAKIGRLLNKKVVVQCKKDPDLLGGFIVNVGNYRVDLSLKTKLAEIAKQAVASA